MKIVYVRPLHKHLSKASIENYRAINLLPMISLIFEQLPCNHLFDLSKDQLHLKPFGFQSRKIGLRYFNW